jgi:hypothetical protein
LIQRKAGGVVSMTIRVMSSPKQMGPQECRAWAEICLVAAQRCSLPEMRTRWRTVAQSWFALADEMDRMGARRIRLAVDNAGDQPQVR